MPVGWAHRDNNSAHLYRSMIRRTTHEWQENHPTYEGVDVCEEWLNMSNFVAWLEKQDWEGKELDKDILCPGNKVYSPETCVFVTRQLNALLCGSDASRGKYPKGVYYSKAERKYAAMFRFYGKNRWLGRFRTSEEAHRAYCKAKAAHIREIAENLTDADTTDIERTRAGLLEHADIEARRWEYVHEETV